MNSNCNDNQNPRGNTFVVPTKTSQDDNSFFASIIDTSANGMDVSKEDATLDGVMSNQMYQGAALGDEVTPQNQNESENSFSSTSYDMRCKCIKTNCLQLYCECFHSGSLCGAQCRCIDCKNVVENETERLAMMAKVLKRNKNAFDEEGSFTKRSRKMKPGCACSTSQCLKKYCSCYWNKVSCAEKCNCIQCENTYGRKILKHALIAGMKEKDVNSSKASISSASTGNQKLKLQSTRKSKGAVIEHYPIATTITKETSTTPLLKLQKEANYNTATANLLSAKQLLSQSRHKLYDLEYAMGQLEDSNASKVRLERQMIAIRESVQSIKDFEKEVKRLEADIAQKYE